MTATKLHGTQLRKDDRMRAWRVLRPDRSETVEMVDDRLPEYEQARRAEFYARETGPVFSARPEGCTGLAWNVHFGAEQACPVHREKGRHDG